MVTVVLKIAQVKKILNDNVLMDNFFWKKFIDITQRNFSSGDLYAHYSTDSFRAHCSLGSRMNKNCLDR